MSRFMPDVEVIRAERKKLHDDASYKPMEHFDRSDLDTPGPHDGRELTDEVSEIMAVLGIKDSPAGAEGESSIVGLWVEVPFTELGETQPETFALLRDRRDVAFGAAPRAGMRLSRQHLSHNHQFMELLRDAAYAKLVELDV